ncbi:hypothetical protein CGLO_10141 [Colletotrichum gloeosporioides Cg-14]|uniref:Uncharacterized protein n=1 Tax=Colletotrichum gloeosporioides (strain Cg-14) TaxID=1237896 RepID=T0KE75_COLGC|nr:hypothetical protein CGLO_10141 [Colletotrichum gloeosporioides Cg-14]
MKYGMGSDGLMGEALFVFFLPSICVVLTFWPDAAHAARRTSNGHAYQSFMVHP